ncbi:MAG: fibrobacter succinogenes major paralogous domain-containing protein [Dysgonamonadaceae bacterium]|nr:fibrobacter succinogenes major paralogous domain-containing protein [Dysgonamonadaceae bacterium]
MKRIFFNVAIITMFAAGAKAQVTIGSLDDPQTFSVLELIGNGKGMRLPQLTTEQREDLNFGSEATGKAMGLQIFNIDTKCVETWNGEEWIMQCYCGSQPCPEPTGTTWTTIQWVGAFWKDDQTGERIIASKVSNQNDTWIAEVVNTPESDGSWINLDGNVYSDPAIWTDSPGDAENHQLPSVRKTSVSGTGNILFRIGATSTNPAELTQDYPSADGGMGKPPRYAKVKISINGGAPDTVFCRQGESADYVFSPNNTYGSNVERSLAAKFSPYNLTASNLTDGDVYADVAHLGGTFVDYPTQAGAFFQWAAESGYERRAYHPTGSVTGLSINTPSEFWSTLKSVHETCPQYWRRPTSGADNAVTTAPASESELMQSLFYTTFDGENENYHNANYRYCGYYADGYFDRRQITNSIHNFANSAVSKDTKDVAYAGLLFTNPDSGNSLFMPTGGILLNTGTLDETGFTAAYWSGSSKQQGYGWEIMLYYGNSSIALHHSDTGDYGYSVRCVVDDIDE